MFFIWDQTLALKEISWKQFNTREKMSLQNVLLFHLRRHVKNSGLALHHGFQTARTEMKALTSICFCPYKGIQDSLGSWIPYRGFQTPGNGSSLCQWNFDYGLQSLVGFRISWVVLRVPKSMIPDSTSKFPRFRIPGIGFQYLSVDLWFWIATFIGIPDSLSCIMDSKAQDSGLYEQKGNPDSLT